MNLEMDVAATARCVSMLISLCSVLICILRATCCHPISSAARKRNDVYRDICADAFRLYI